MKWSGPCTVERGGMGDVMAVRNRPIRGGHGDVPGHAAAEGHADLSALCCHLRTW